MLSDAKRGGGNGARVEAPGRWGHPSAKQRPRWLGGCPGQSTPPKLPAPAVPCKREPSPRQKRPQMGLILSRHPFTTIHDMPSCPAINVKPIVLCMGVVLIIGLPAGRAVESLSVLTYNTSGNGVADWSTNSAQVRSEEHTSELQS